MAMKVTNTTIHRLSVDMSCGCTMYAEFHDAQCKEPILPPTAETSTPDPRVRVFIPCQTHGTDAALSMLNFIIGERLDEAIEEAQKTPVHLYELPPTTTTSSDGTITGGSVSTVAKINKPNAVRSREKQDPLAIKTKQRPVEELRAIGSVLNKTTVEMQIDEVEENEVVTDHLAELFDVVGGEPSI
jgi:hypothetical protein